MRTTSPVGLHFTSSWIISARYIPRRYYKISVFRWKVTIEAILLSLEISLNMTYGFVRWTAIFMLRCHSLASALNDVKSTPSLFSRHRKIDYYERNIRIEKLSRSQILIYDLSSIYVYVIIGKKNTCCENIYRTFRQGSRKNWIDIGEYRCALCDFIFGLTVITASLAGQSLDWTIVWIRLRLRPRKIFDNRISGSMKL